MGYIRHEAIVVTSYNKDYVKTARGFANSLELDTTEIITTINGYSTFLIAPDGSKEGWDKSNKHEQARIDWCSWAKQQYKDGIYFDYAYISFGGDDAHCRVIRYGNEERE